MAAIITCDIAIVGGGLSGCLFALALHKARPDLDIKLIERDQHLGGNHYWSFFAADIAKGERDLLAPMVAHAWPSYHIKFPAHARHFAMPYYTISSERMDEHVRATLPEGSILFGHKAIAASANAVVLGDGLRVEAGGVIDCRGASHYNDLEVGWQKFLGRELIVDRPHGVELPTVMDATVEQIDGYRFVYVLPTGPDRLFVEDTYYSDTAMLDKRALRRRIAAYAADHGWAPRVPALPPVAEMIGHNGGDDDGEGINRDPWSGEDAREEWGALPVVIGGDFEAYWRGSGNRVAKGGVRAGLFHPTTGYSLPDAVRAAHLVAKSNDLSGAALHDLLYAHARNAWESRGFYRMLDAMLFRAAQPQERYKVLQRFYGLDARLIGRFYAGRSTLFDKARVLVGKPPVPIGRAIAAIRGAKG